MLLRRCFASLASLAVASAAALAPAHPLKQRAPEGDPAEEAYLHTPPGFACEGRPAVADAADRATLSVRVIDRGTGEPAFCRVNVVASDGNYYEPHGHALAPWSLHRTANRQGKGPIRYYGWFFYTPGTFTVDVPAGPARIEVWKGYEYRPVHRAVDAAAAETRQVQIEIERTAPMAEIGYYSGDTHVHLDRRTRDDDQRALDLLAAEDIHLGYILCMNDPRAYSGVMARQEWPQQRGFGPSSQLSRGPYSIVSGQEYRCGTYGHICFLMHDRLVLEGITVDPNNWPVFGLAAQEVRRLGGYSFHAHGGYSKEIYADFAQRATDGVELLQFAEYRGVSLEGWYRMLSVGYRFPAVGASDFPYCRALGDCRTYVHCEQPPSCADWARRAAEGRSFFTTGPLVLLEVETRRPGDTIELAGPGPHQVVARVRVRCEVTPVASVDVVVGGQVVRRMAVPGGLAGHWIELEHKLSISDSTWVAARAHSLAPSGRPDAEAHTNPVYIHVDGRAPYRQTDLDWLVERLDERIDELAARDFVEKEMALEFFRTSRAELIRLRGTREQQ